MTKKILIILPGIILFSYVIFIGISGVDFGYHWDEKSITGLVNRYVRNRTLLPRWYAYPSLSSYLATTVTIPYAVPFIKNFGFEWNSLQYFLLSSVLEENPSFLLNVRKTFIFTSSLSVLWVYLVKICWKRDWFEAITAASILGLSWEIGYHSRWVTPDAIMMQFGAMTVLFTFLGIQKGENRNLWFLLASVSAGFATATKYPGGLLIVPVFLGYFLSRDKGHSHLRVISNLSFIFIVFGLSYLLMNPGTIFQSERFLEHILGEMEHYSRGHGFQTVNGGLHHLSLIIIYLSNVLFSHYRPIALFFFVFSIIGCWAIFRESARNGIVLLSFPILYTAYFSLQNVMFVRNLLVLAPFLSILSARGIKFVGDKARSKTTRYSLYSLVFGLLIINGIWGFHAMKSIQNIGTKVLLQNLISEIRTSNDQTFFVTETVWEEIESILDYSLENISLEYSDDVDFVVFNFYEDMFKPGFWPVNMPGLAPKSLGPWEINLDYYFAWQGSNRILITTPEKAKNIGVILFQEG